jgi:hypothetical protein
MKITPQISHFVSSLSSRARVSLPPPAALIAQRDHIDPKERCQSHILIPNRVLIGPYPYPVKKKDQELKPSIDICTKHLQGHVMNKHNVSVFCCLLKELPLHYHSEKVINDPNSGAIFHTYPNDILKFSNEDGKQQPIFLHVKRQL